MRANELRLGNYLESYSGGKYFQITIDDLIIINNGESRANPIPLTGEWLFKFGFEENKNYEHPSFDEYVIDDFGIGNYNDQYWIIDFLDQSIGSPEIKHVHQLQNLYFALTGEELTIKP